MSRVIEISVTNECQGCDLMKLKTYKHDIIPYCTLFKTFLQFREYENDDWIVKPCYECVECTGGGNTHYFENGEYKEKGDVKHKYGIGNIYNSYSLYSCLGNIRIYRLYNGCKKIYIL